MVEYTYLEFEGYIMEKRITVDHIYDPRAEGAAFVARNCGRHPRTCNDCGSGPRGGKGVCHCFDTLTAKQVRPGAGVLEIRAVRKDGRVQAVLEETGDEASEHPLCGQRGKRR